MVQERPGGAWRGGGRGVRSPLGGGGAIAPARDNRAGPGIRFCVCPGGTESSRICKPLGQHVRRDIIEHGCFCIGFCNIWACVLPASSCIHILTWLASKYASELSMRPRKAVRGVAGRGMRVVFAPGEGGAPALAGDNRAGLGLALDFCGHRLSSTTDFVPS